MRKGERGRKGGRGSEGERAMEGNGLTGWRTDRPTRDTNGETERREKDIMENG